jgi:molecular chaperone GrpE
MTEEPIKNNDDLEESDDVTFEAHPDGLEQDVKDRTEKLRAKIKDLEAKNAELLLSWQKDKADFINTRKRDEEDKKEFLKFAKADIISEIIPVLDSFDNAMKNKEVWEKVDKNWRIGVEYINSQLHSTLAGHGLKVINPIGEMYNSGRDEAVETVKVDSKEEDNKILEVVQVGYELNRKEIRAPKVKVGHFE